MIATITLNPSIDRNYIVDDFEIDSVHRSNEYTITAGGKGVNVAKVVQCLMEPVMATGFLGGHSGAFIIDTLMALGILTDFINISGETRNCISIISKNCQTEILEKGPIILGGELEALYKKYDDILDKAEIICASGSIPNNLPNDIYASLAKKAKLKKKLFFLDTSGSGLIQGLNGQPFLIKPNLSELEAIAQETLSTEESIIRAAKKLSDRGIEFIVISLAERGAIVLHKQKIYRVYIPKVKVINPVGSGDSMVAGFAVALQRKYDIKSIIAFGAACGTANALEKETGKVQERIVLKLMKEINIIEIP
ncbi:1-phosphofructokinase family hexose kinase [Alkaliphilus peptidifermentans]|uniref:Tagatose-6-phosphate kinase n=1 Tax=Alkaliphilus peptidifermentans DSM 18978 TaxID=1120976 RepID=A0A1G5FYD1_9FIRM|nr:1-phosphofructokinase family hexose kinase [Alkaliphilus peptidifermentans]SCY44276.1 tagatose 6-phosphate kinase [Alkaliphilus peptidifermentans DSM 18978]